MKTVVASWFGTGLILGKLRGSDSGSGTVGSLFALPLAIWLGDFGVWAQVLATAVVIALAVWSIGSLVATTGDAGWIVIDEAAGVFLAVIGLTWLPGIIAFVVFRLADIYKIPGVARAEAAPGTSGVLADDLVAGIYGLAAGLIAAYFIA